MERGNMPAAEQEDSRLRILFLYQMLRRDSDERHPLSTRQIMEKMEAEHGITMHRTTLPRDVEILRRAGVEVMTERRRALWYYLADRPFSLPELRLLIDAVLSSRFITESKSKELAGKLIALTGDAGADRLRRTVHVTGKPKSLNEKGYYIVDAINEAIRLRRKISFHSFDLSSTKAHVLKNGGAPYTVSPYDLIWDGDFYYMTGFCDERGEIRVFRVDRIERPPEILDQPAVKRPRGYRTERYTQEAFRMFAAQETAEVRLLCHASVMNAVVDKFGHGVRTKSLGPERFRATVKVCVTPTFFRWVFGWDGRIRIEGPEEVRERYREVLRGELEGYQQELSESQGIDPQSGRTGPGNA